METLPTTILGGSAPGGSSGQIQYNLSGAFAGLSTTNVDGSGNITLSSRWISSLSGAASAPPATLTGTWFTGGTGTTTKPQFLIEPTGTTSTAWNTNGTGLGVNAASGFTGNLLDLQVNGTSACRITPTNAYFPSTGIYVGNRPITITSNSLYLSGGLPTYMDGLLIAGGSITLALNTSIVSPVTLVREAAYTLSLLTGNNPNTFRIYNAYTDVNNYERLSTTWSSNVCYTKPENAGTGSARLYVPVTGSTTVASLPSAATAGTGARSFVTDATATTYLSIVTGGGANKVPVVSDGTNWLIG